METDQKAERDTDSIMDERENAENLPAAEKAPTQGGATDWEQYQNWYNYMNCQNWLGMNNGGVQMSPTEMDSFDKWGNQNPMVERQ